MNVPYEVAPNLLPTTLGKYHLRSTDPDFHREDSEQLAQRNSQVFDTLKDAEMACRQLNDYCAMLAERMPIVAESFKRNLFK